MVGYNNNRGSYPANDFREREPWGGREDRDAGAGGYQGSVWQSYGESHDGSYMRDSYNQRADPYGREAGYRQDVGPYDAYAQPQRNDFDRRGGAGGAQGGGSALVDDYHGGAGPYVDEGRPYENEYGHSGYDDRVEPAPAPPERPARRPLRPGEKPDPIKDMLYEMQGNTYNLPPSANDEPKKFTARCRLFIAPLPASVSEEELRQWFGQYGEVGEVFLNKAKNFAFVKMDTRENCEAAKNSLDFAKKDGITIRVRFSSNPAAVRVSNLTNFVTNELLETAFSVFGEIERAVVIADERGRPTGVGVVEFAQKRSALLAIRRCEEECFLLTASPRPVMVEPYDFRDEDEGLPERNLNKNKAYQSERELGPRTAMPGSFEYEFGIKWKQLFELEAKKKEQLEYDNKRCRQMMDEQLDYYMYEHEANVLREKLRAMEEQTQQIQRERDMRMRAEEMNRKRRDEDDFRVPPDGRRPMGAAPFGGMGGQGGRTSWQMGPPQVPPPYQSSRPGQPPLGLGPRY